MDKAMTVRFDEKLMKQLESMQGTGWDKWKKSSLLRVAVSFMYECVENLPKGRDDNSYNLTNALNLKYKTKLMISKWNW